jgi:hypothetical protein
MSSMFGFSQFEWHNQGSEGNTVEKQFYGTG